MAEPFTRLEGIPQKHTGEEPFNASDKLLNLINKKDYGDYYYEPVNSVPVNFLLNPRHYQWQLRISNDKF